MDDPTRANQESPPPECFDGFDDVPFHRYLGLRLVERRPDHARLRLTIGDLEAPRFDKGRDTT